MSTRGVKGFHSRIKIMPASASGNADLGMAIITPAPLTTLEQPIAGGYGRYSGSPWQVAAAIDNAAA
jgi:hypothetical protein